MRHSPSMVTVLLRFRRRGLCRVAGVMRGSLLETVAYIGMCTIVPVGPACLVPRQCSLIAEPALHLPYERAPETADQQHAHPDEQRSAGVGDFLLVRQNSRQPLPPATSGSTATANHRPAASISSLPTSLVNPHGRTHSTSIPLVFGIIVGGVAWR